MSSASQLGQLAERHDRAPQGQQGEQGRPFQNGTRCLKTKHEARCPRILADPRQKLSGAEVGFEVPYTALLPSLERPGIPRRRP
jgi:hypothetical protein